MSEQINKREKFNILLTPEEKNIIIEKALKYGYGTKLAEYIRDACIHEKIYIEDVKGKQEIFKAIDNYLKEVRIYMNKVDDLLKNINITKEDVIFVKNQNEKIIKSIDDLVKTVITVLSTNSTVKFQKRLRFIEKHKVTKEFIDSIIKRKFALVQPSNLNFKRTTNTFILIYNQYSKQFDIENLNYNSLTVLIDTQRELALQNNFYILLELEDYKLSIMLVKCFTNKDEALKVYQNESRKGNDIDKLDFIVKEG